MSCLRRVFSIDNISIFYFEGVQSSVPFFFFSLLSFISSLLADSLGRFADSVGSCAGSVDSYADSVCNCGDVETLCTFLADVSLPPSTQ